MSSSILEIHTALRGMKKFKVGVDMRRLSYVMAALESGPEVVGVAKLANKHQREVEPKSVRCETYFTRHHLDDHNLSSCQSVKTLRKCRISIIRAANRHSPLAELQ